MKQILLTVALGIVFILLALLGLSIGYLITGKPKLKNRCGQIPGKEKDKQCGTDKTCPICSGEMNKPKQEKKEES